MVTIHAHLIESIKEALILPNLEALQGWGQYLKVGVPIMVMVCSEAWVWEMLLIMSGMISVTDQAAYIILNNLSQ